MAFDDELESFQAYAKALPNNCVFLVDTFDTIEGVKKAIKIGEWLKQQGKPLLGIRLDSGDLADLSIRSRKLLDEAGFPDAKIFASNELDETIIAELKRQGAKITIWAVGTNLVTGKEQPALDGVYKMSAIRDPGKEWKYKLKLSEQMKKVSNPGILQVRRFAAEGENMADMIYDISSAPSEESRMVDPFDPTKEMTLKKGLKSWDLLQPVFRGGKRIYEIPSLQVIKENTKQELARFPVGIKRFLNPHLYPVGMEKSLYDVKIKLIKQIRNPNGKI
jgi:nicotinate phosphoribosyltransferase